MKFRYLWVLMLPAVFSCNSGDQPKTEQSTATPETNIGVRYETITDESGFNWQVCQFADIRVLRYQIPGWDKLTPKQKELVYYLSQAGLAGRDIMWDQNFASNLEIRSGLENIYSAYNGDKTAADWKLFEVYLHQVWFSNGIHHHYSNAKHVPAFSKEYLAEISKATNTTFSDAALNSIFDPAYEAKKVERDAAKGLLEGSAINFYGPDVTTEEAHAFYEGKNKPNERAPLSYGINSRLVKENGQLVEQVWKVGGLYTEAIEKIVFWLEKATSVAENEKQASAIKALVEYYKTGDLRQWDNFNILWVNATEGDIDFINGFVEVYNDPLDMRGSYESIVEIKDFDASARMKVLMDNAQWFEDNSSIMKEHKKAEVVGITYNVVNTAGESGDASPSTPIGVNLPNANWIRAKFGSKSVSLGNIEDAYDKAAGAGMLEEFCHDQEEVDRAKKFGAIAGKLHTAMHEVIGHASGKIHEGVGRPAETLKQYASTIEEGRADLVALYYILDPHLIELGLVESDEIGKCEYDSYLRNGLLVQLRRVKEGEDIEEAHMRNRAWISRWVVEKGKADNVVEEVKKDGKTYYDIKDYNKLRELFGQLLREIQRITSEGDFAAAAAIADGYGKKVDPTLHKEVLDRAAGLNIAPYAGFINPVLEPVTDANGNITDVKVTYPENFADQMLMYSKTYSTLPVKK